MFYLHQLLELQNFSSVSAFIKEHFNIDIKKRELKYEDIYKWFSFVGENESNASTIDLLQTGEKGLVERITNAIDAVFEKDKIESDVIYPKTSEDIIKAAYPEYYKKTYKHILKNKRKGRQVYDAAEKVIVVALDGEKPHLPTFDVVDFGTGIKGSEFIDTILSLQGGNKIKENKNY